jgi:hypothetical protein
MPDLAAMLADRGAFAGLATKQMAIRASLAWAAILDKPTDVVFVTVLGQTLAPQKVRVESANRATVQQSAAGMGPMRELVIFGVRGHPTVADTDMQEGYTFVQDNDAYTCVDVIVTIGEIQGIWQASG